jgi:sialate O-acetylesterase
MLRITLCSFLALFTVAQAQIKLPAIIGDNMVLQQNLANPIWGWDKPGTNVTVTFAGQTKTAVADANGKWTVKLDPLPVNAAPAAMSIAGTTQVEVKNILVGEVWICSGQSNMQWSVNQSWDADLESLTAKYPHIRLISVPQVGTQEPQQDFKGAWAECAPENVGGFSAVGFFFGRVLHQALNVPVGLINNAWGGSAAEAWVNRSELEKDPRFKLLMDNTVANEARMADPATKEKYEADLAAWKKQAEEAKAAGKPFNTRQPGAPDQWLRGNARPGNIYNGVLLPTIGYGIKGAIWYQGESNASRAYEYASLFPFMIQNWRAEWNQGDFPFYWVQLADFMAEKTNPDEAVASAWAELRESQTKTQAAIQNGGQAVIIDLGEANDIHPKNKRDVAERLARWALAKDYGMKLPHRSPEFKSAEFAPGKAVVTLDTFGGTLRTVDVSEVKGFVICGEDKKWAWAKAKIAGKDKVEVSAEGVAAPVAVRYAWSDNPICNLFSTDGLPVTPFRSDTFPMLTQPK